MRYALLGLLAQQAGSGYDLLKRFETTLANVWPATQSQLYGELGKLAADDFISASDIGPRGRKEYVITSAGRDALRDWITEPTTDPFRSTLLLRVFLLGEVSPAEAEDYIAEFAALAASELARLQHIAATTEADESRAAFYSTVTLDYGIRYAAMEVEWAQAVLKAIDRSRSREKRVTR